MHLGPNAEQGQRSLVRAGFEGKIDDYWPMILHERWVHPFSSHLISPDRVVVHVGDEVHRRTAAHRDQEHKRGLDHRIRNAEVGYPVLPVL